MGIGMRRHLDSTICEAHDVYGKWCNTSVKYEATWIANGAPIRLCMNHESEFRHRGLIQDSIKVKLSDLT